MKYGYYFSEQYKMHPSMQYEDVIKLCYQAAFGAEHLISDPEAAQKYLRAEFESAEPTDDPLFEQISDDVCRVNIGAWKKAKLPFELLVEAFLCSPSFDDTEERRRLFLLYIKEAEEMMKRRMTEFSSDEWRAFLDEYKKSGMPSIRHSAIYREKEKPSYRVIKLESILKKFHK